MFGRDVRELMMFFNAFMESKFIKGSSNEVLISDNNVIFKIESSGNSQGSSSYRGEYEPGGATEFNSGAFAFGDIVRVSPSNTVATTATPAGSVIPGVYICIQDAPSDTDLPNHPLSPGGETIFWHWISTYPSVTNSCDGDGNTISRFTDEQDSNA